jgi:sugar lactone lactonase YvrE
MAETRILQSFRPPEESLQGLAWVQGKIWVTGVKANRIFGQEERAAGVYDTVADLASPVKNPGGLAWDGQAFLVADRYDKAVYRVDPDSGVAEPVLNLAELKYGGAPEIFRAEASQVTDITWGREHLWVACQAGYSSSVFRIDVQAGEVVQHFWARGPKPEGITFDAEGAYLWTVDASNREFSQFTPDGEWTEETAPSPIDRPCGLAMDDQGAFWTSDEESGLVYQIEREA